MSPIHRKTAKGIAEFETRSHGLSARMRSALILVDGQRSDADILQLLGPPAEAMLVELTWQNFIERVPEVERAEKASRPGRQSARKAAAPTLRVQMQSGSASAGFAALRKHAVTQLTARLGPFAQTLAVSIERAEDDHELRPLLERATGLIEGMLGAEAAISFRSELQPPEKT